MTIRIDHVTAIRELAAQLAAEHSDLRIGLITAKYADSHRGWSEPVRFKIIPDETHPGLEIVHIEADA